MNALIIDKMRYGTATTGNGSHQSRAAVNSKVAGTATKVGSFVGSAFSTFTKTVGDFLKKK